MKSLVVANALLLVCAAALAEPASYAVDPTHAAAIYEIDHFGTSTNRGRFNVKRGSVTIDRAAKTGKVEVTIDVASVDTGVPALNRHVASKDFLDAADHPTASFVGDRFVFDGDRVSEVGGQLTLLDKSAPVTLKALRFNCYTNPIYKREVCGGDFETTIQRSLWGIDWGLARGFADRVHLLIQVEAIRQ
jgi:polyisoprenoid-binding protein YceI